MTDYRRTNADEPPKEYGPKKEYKADVCPPIDSPEFLKMFPLDLNLDFSRIQAARAHGYGD